MSQISEEDESTDSGGFNRSPYNQRRYVNFADDMQVKSTTGTGRETENPRNTNEGIQRENLENNRSSSRGEDKDNDEFKKSKWKLSLEILLTFLTVLIFAIAFLLIKGMADFHLYAICVLIFQGLLWPSIILMIFQMFKRDVQNYFAPFGESWINILLLEALGVVGSGVLILFLTSIELLDLTVAFSLTFPPVILISLINFINQYKTCSIELLVFECISYIGIILILLPAVTGFLNTEEEIRNLYTGVGASLAAMLLSYPASILLKFIRGKNINEELIAIATGFNGTIISFIIGGSLGVIENSSFDSSIGWGAGLFLLTFFGVIFSYLEVYFGSSTLLMNNEGKRVVSFSRLQIFIFLAIAIWEITFKQIYKREAPNVFSIFGVTMIVISILLTFGYLGWINSLKKLNIKFNSYKEPFYFIPWLFSQKVSYNTKEESENGNIYRD